MIQTATDHPMALAEAVGYKLAREDWRPQWRCERIAAKVTPLVLDSARRYGRYDTDDNYPTPLRAHKALLISVAETEVRAALGIFQWLLWQFVIPKIIEWIVDWYFSANGEAMRARHRAEASE